MNSQIQYSPGVKGSFIEKISHFGIRLPFACLWYVGRFLKQSFLMIYFKTIGRYGFSKIGSGTIIDGWVTFIWPCADIQLGRNSRIGKRCVFQGAPTSKIKIGSKVTINDGCYLTSLFSITIGDGTSIDEYTSIRDYDHCFEDISVPIKEQGYRGAQIEIGRDCWIGRGCMITAGVTIGEGSVIGANSVVTHSIAPFSVAVGAPARVIRVRRP